MDVETLSVCELVVDGAVCVTRSHNQPKITNNQKLVVALFWLNLAFTIADAVFDGLTLYHVNGQEVINYTETYTVNQSHKFGERTLHMDTVTKRRFRSERINAQWLGPWVFLYCIFCIVNLPVQLLQAIYVTFGLSKAMKKTKTATPFYVELFMLTSFLLENVLLELSIFCQVNFANHGSGNRALILINGNYGINGALMFIFSLAASFANFAALYTVFSRFECSCMSLRRPTKEVWKPILKIANFFLACIGIASSFSLFALIDQSDWLLVWWVFWIGSVIMCIYMIPLSILLCLKRCGITI